MRSLLARIQKICSDAAGQFPPWYTFSIDRATNVISRSFVLDAAKGGIYE
jgi:hypothetical protein